MYGHDAGDVHNNNRMCNKGSANKPADWKGGYFTEHPYIDCKVEWKAVKIVI